MITYLLISAMITAFLGGVNIADGNVETYNGWIFYAIIFVFWPLLAVAVIGLTIWSIFKFRKL